MLTCALTLPLQVLYVIFRVAVEELPFRPFIDNFPFSFLFLQVLCISGVVGVIRVSPENGIFGWAGEPIGLLAALVPFFAPFGRFGELAARSFSLSFLAWGVGFSCQWLSRFAPSH